MNNTFIVHNSKMQPLNWGGGSTKELFIYPQNAQFKKLNFDFRLSTAIIEADESVFSALPGVKRKLVLLEGDLTLFHENHHSKKIERFDEDNFLGDWKTKSKGKAIDFNFMGKPNTNANINVLDFQKDTQFTDKNLHDFSFIYVYKGKLSCELGEINEGDLWVNTEKKLFDFMVTKKSILVHITVDLQQ